jgi:transcriptional regulator with XRE-family HTH domain
VTPLSHSDSKLKDQRVMLSRTEDNAVLLPDGTAPGPYGLPVRDSSIGRKLAFAAFIRKALEDARTTRAWTNSEVARQTGVSRQTIHRWVRGDWVSDPEPERVVAFCEGLGINPTTAFGILGWDRSAAARPAAPPPPMDPDIEALLRRLLDPNTPEAEKYHIRETVRYLAYRPPVTTSRKAGKRAS